MARPGTFGGFYFDPEVFSEHMNEQQTWSNAIIASGILQEDATIMDLIGEKGNVATLPFFTPISIDDYEPLNNDGLTDNTPDEISGKKQTTMLIQRMKAFKAQDFTKELTGADEMGHIASSVNDYYRQVWERELMNTISAVLAVPDIASTHVEDIASTSGTIEDANKVNETTMIFAQQKALGDMANGFGLAIMNSYIFARYQALGLINYNKYVITNALEREITLPTINGLITVVSDRYTIDTSDTLVKYKTLIAGRGSILTAQKTNYEQPYYTDYDPETNAGVQKLYTKQGRVLHPNGFSLAADNIANESPTLAELGNSANWSLRFDPKNIRLGQIISNG